MKSFSRRGYLIAYSPFEVRLVYTFFLIFVLVGFVTILGYQCRRIGPSPSAIAGHYRGNADSRLLEEGQEMKFEKTFPALLETTHFHAFIMGLVYLTLAHIFVATRTSQGTKNIFIVGAFVFTFLDLVLPWLIRYLSSGFSHLMLVTWIGEWLAYMGLTLIPLYDMWWKKEKSFEGAIGPKDR